MLNGVGGRTVAEAMQQLTPAELGLWARYRQTVGSLNPADRNEWMLAQLSALFASAHGAEDVTIYDFAPHFDPPPPREYSFGEILEMQNLL